MKSDIDRRVANILREGAPPRSDPMFRVRVLQRLELRRFKRRLYSLAIAACGATGVTVATLSANAEATGVALLCAVVAVATFAHAPIVGYAWRRLVAGRGRGAS